MDTRAMSKAKIENHMKESSGSDQNHCVACMEFNTSNNNPSASLLFLAVVPFERGSWGERKAPIMLSQVRISLAGVRMVHVQHATAHSTRTQLGLLGLQPFIKTLRLQGSWRAVPPGSRSSRKIRLEHQPQRLLEVFDTLLERRDAVPVP